MKTKEDQIKDLKIKASDLRASYSRLHTEADICLAKAEVCQMVAIELENIAYDWEHENH